MTVADLPNRQGVAENAVGKDRALVEPLWEQKEDENNRVVVVKKERDEQKRRLQNNLEAVMWKERLRKSEKGMVQVQRKRQETDNGSAQLSVELTKFGAELSEVQGDAEAEYALLTRVREKLDTMTVSRDRLGVRGDKVVRGVTEVVELFRDGEMELMNQLVNGVGDVVKHVNNDRS